MELVNQDLGLLETHFGWVLSGTTPTPKVSNSALTIQVNHSTLQEDLKSFWSLEHAGILTKYSASSEVFKDLERTITRQGDGRYVARLPFNRKAEILTSNWLEAKRRLRGLVFRLKDKPDIRRRYVEAVQAYFDMDHAEIVPACQAPGYPLYYIPHHAVVREDRVTTKVRVVFDASSHAKNGISLNDCLHTGPSLNPDCTALLIRWRSYKVVFVADIIKAFLQVSLAPQDQDAVRFLWLHPKIWDQPFSERLFTECLQICRMKVVIFGANCSPFLLCGTIRHHAKKYASTYSEASKMLDKNLYMDDLLGGAHTEADAVTRYQEIKTILLEAQMPLSKWATSSLSLHKTWMDCNEDVANKDVVFPSEDLAKILGLHWSPKDDTFSFNRKISISQPCTKRTILQTIARLFDLLGFLGPFLIRAKILMQDLWRSTVSWDEPVTTDIYDQWASWVAELKIGSKIRIPRFLLHGADTRSWSLHLFVDASEHAYEAVVYCRMKKGEYNLTSLIASKARVAPIQRIPLPRLELMGALLGVRLLDYVLKALDMPTTCSDIHCWSDSQITLYWILGDSQRWKTFVANRVQEIQDLCPAASWRFVPGKDNPADLLTRGEDLQSLQTNSFWWHGPGWLVETKNKWPDIALGSGMKTGEEQVAVTVATIRVTESPIDIKRFSSLSRLLRVTAWIRRFRPSAQFLGSTLSAAELEEALLLWVQTTQEEAFLLEIPVLRSQNALPSKSAISQFAPFLEGSLLRIRGRLKEADLPHDSKHPFLLSPGGPFVSLLIMAAHSRLFHAGTQEVLADLRERFWVIRGRKAVQRCIRRCLVCRRLKTRPCVVPEAPLPADRVRPKPAFCVVGIDFAGPLYIKQAEGSMTKSYVALFSCAVTRAIHCELVSSMTVEDFLLSLRRFFSRYGVSEVIYSDNARTFLRARKELCMLWQLVSSSKTKDFIANRGCRWVTIVERAPWWGGFWERMVRSVKEKLRRVLGHQRLGFEELSTVLLEVSAAINFRPLCYLSEDVSDWSLLTPGHFLLCSRLAALPSLLPLTAKPDSTASVIRRKWRQRAQILDGFWKHWRKDYLLQLRNFQEVHPRTGDAPLKVGDLVLMSQDPAPRHCWPLARVTKVFPGRDGHIRSCEVCTSAGNKFHRAAKVLHLLEMCDTPVTAGEDV